MTSKEQAELDLRRQQHFQRQQQFGQSYQDRLVPANEQPYDRAARQMLNRQALERQKRDLENSIGVLRVTGDDATELEAQLAEVDRQIAELNT